MKDIIDEIEEELFADEINEEESKTNLVEEDIMNAEEEAFMRGWDEAA